MSDQGARPAHLRELNERTVYRTIRALRPVSRAEVARRTQLSKPTVSLALRNLESAGLVAESIAPRAVGGRAGIMYEPVSDAAFAVGAEVDASVVRAALTDLDGQELARVVVDHDGSSPETILGSVVVAVSQLIPKRSRRRLRAVAIGMPGIIDRVTGELSHSGVLPALDGMTPHRFLERELRAPVRVMNDVDLGALGEQARGHGRRCKDFAVISIGSGMGAALILDGRLYQGARGGAGEIDDIPFRRVVHSRQPVSPALDGMTSVLVDLAPSYPSSLLRPPYAVGAVFAALKANDELARATVEQLAIWTSWFVCSVAAVVDPELIVLAGPIGAHEELAAGVRIHLAELLPSAPAVVVSELNEDSVIAGALAVASAQALDAVLNEHVSRTA